MKLQSKKRTFLAGFLILFLIPSHSAEFEINFIETQIIVVDDKSTDGSDKIIENFLKL